MNSSTKALQPNQNNKTHSQIHRIDWGKYISAILVNHIELNRIFDEQNLYQVTVLVHKSDKIDMNSSTNTLQPNQNYQINPKIVRIFLWDDISAILVNFMEGNRILDEKRMWYMTVLVHKADEIDMNSSTNPLQPHQNYQPHLKIHRISLWDDISAILVSFMEWNRILNENNM